jgi:hypothetical protein
MNGTGSMFLGKRLARFAHVCPRSAEKSYVYETKKKKLAGTTGLEPATSDVTGRRSNQLNYVPFEMNYVGNVILTYRSSYNSNRDACLRTATGAGHSRHPPSSGKYSASRMGLESRWAIKRA